MRQSVTLRLQCRSSLEGMHPPLASPPHFTTTLPLSWFSLCPSTSLLCDLQPNRLNRFPSVILFPAISNRCCETHCSPTIRISSLTSRIISFTRLIFIPRSTLFFATSTPTLPLPSARSFEKNLYHSIFGCRMPFLKPAHTGMCGLESEFSLS